MQRGRHRVGSNTWATQTNAGHKAFKACRHKSFSSRYRVRCDLQNVIEGFLSAFLSLLPSKIHWPHSLVKEKPATYGSPSPLDSTNKKESLSQNLVHAWTKNLPATRDVSSPSSSSCWYACNIETPRTFSDMRFGGIEPMYHLYQGEYAALQACVAALQAWVGDISIKIPPKPKPGNAMTTELNLTGCSFLRVTKAVPDTNSPFGIRESGPCCSSLSSEREHFWRCRGPMRERGAEYFALNTI